MSKHINRVKRRYLLSCARALRTPRVTIHVGAEDVRRALEGMCEQMATRAMRQVIRETVMEDGGLGR